jgi:hypothetical protein
MLDQQQQQQQQGLPPASKRTKQQQQQQQELQPQPAASTEQLAVRTATEVAYFLLQRAVSDLTWRVTGILSETAYGWETPCADAQLHRQLLIQASVSLLLTVAKLPSVTLGELTNDALCSSLGLLLGELADPLGAPDVARIRLQQQQQQQCAEPHPAVMALAGHTLIQLGGTLSALAARDAVAACHWLAKLLLRKEKAAGRADQHGRPDTGVKGSLHGSLGWLLCSHLRLDHCKMVDLGQPPAAAAAADVPCCSNGSHSAAMDCSTSSSSSSGFRTSVMCAAAPGGSATGPPPLVSFSCELAITRCPCETDPASLHCFCMRSMKEVTLSLQRLLRYFEEQDGDLKSDIAKKEKALAEMDADLNRLAAALSNARRAGAPAGRCAQFRLKIKVVQSQQQEMLQMVQSARDAATRLADDLSSGIRDYACRLDKLGVLLSALLPTRYCCNNPGCASWQTDSEGFLLVRGKACVCAGCIAADNGSTAEASAYCFAARWVLVACGLGGVGSFGWTDSCAYTQFSKACVVHGRVMQ